MVSRLGIEPRTPCCGADRAAGRQRQGRGVIDTTQRVLSQIGHRRSSSVSSTVFPSSAIASITRPRVRTSLSAAHVVQTTGSRRSKPASWAASVGAWGADTGGAVALRERSSGHVGLGTSTYSTCAARSPHPRRRRLTSEVVTILVLPPSAGVAHARRPPRQLRAPASRGRRAWECSRRLLAGALRARPPRRDCRLR